MDGGYSGGSVPTDHDYQRAISLYKRKQKRELMNFSEMNLSEPILKAVAEAGYVSPSPIQEQTIPIVLTGSDVLGCAQTGTGKTAAFALPILQNLSKRGRSGKIRALVLTPRVSSLCKTMKAFANTANIHPCAAVSSLVEWGSLPRWLCCKRAWIFWWQPRPSQRPYRAGLHQA